jgi:2-oxoglutarate ferredoxin oxidoreductase subunit alpha
MTRRLIEGSEAIASAMVSAGCRFFSGYPMTPFTEVLEGMAKLLPEVGGTCMNAESEIEAVGMAWGAASTGTRAATGSVGQGLSLVQESLSEICFARLPLVVLNMARGQGDYFQATRGGGHGDYRHIVLAPADVPEAVRLIQLAFHLADEWRNPVLFMGDYYLAHVQEAVDTSPIDFGPVAEKPWALDGSSSGSGAAKLVSPIFPRKRNDPAATNYGEYLEQMAVRFGEMAQGVEPIVETGFTDDAELVVVAYGTPGRYIRFVVSELRAQGVPIGFVRPVTLWPFPTEAVARAAAGARAVAVYELNTGQMFDDVRLAVLGSCPVHFIGRLRMDHSGFGMSFDLDVEILSARLRSLLDEVRRESA